MSPIAQRLGSLPGLLSLSVPAAVVAHCAGYEVSARGQRWLGPITADAHAGHGLSGHGALEGHAAAASVHAGHLPLLPVTTGALLVGAALVLTAVAGGRRLGRLTPPSLGALLVTQVMTVGAIEAAGHVSGLGISGASLLMALVLQLPVALVVVHIVRGAQRLLNRLVASSEVVSVRGRAPRPVVSDVACCGTTLWFMQPPGRAPPRGSWLPSLPALART